MKKIATTSNSTSSNNSNNQTTNMKNQNTAAPKKVFTYNKETVNPSTLQIHPILLAAGPLVSNNVFVDFYNEFNFLETPVVTEDGFVITHAADVVGAQHLGISEIEVVVMKNANQEDVVRFISFKDVICHGKNKTNLSTMVKFLTNHLKNTEPGKQWAAEFETTKTRNILAKIAGCSTGKIQGVMAIEKNNPGLLVKIDRKEITAAQALKQIKAPNTIPLVSSNRYDDVLFSSKDKNDAAKYKLNTFTLNYEGLGEFNLTVSDTAVAGSLNGMSLGEMSHSVRCDYESKGPSLSQHVQSHVFLPVNDRFSIQVIIRDLDQLEGGQMAIAA